MQRKFSGKYWGRAVGTMLAGAASLAMVSCGPSDTSAPAGSDASATEETLTLGAIPDEDPERLQRQYQLLSDYLSAELGVPVEYKPVTDYAAAVTGFKTGDLELVWFGALTGVQARLQVPDAEAIAQRQIDTEFTSVFIANTGAGLSELSSVEELATLKGKTFTFGSESSTSGRLMPQAFLEKAGVSLEDFKGEAGFAGDHDKTIKVVEAGSYEVGALSSSTWNKRTEANEVDLDQVQLIFETPAYFNYHWVLNPVLKEQFGDDIGDRILAAFEKLDPSNPDHKEILDLFGAERFIPTANENYNDVESVGRVIGKIR
ncbi:MAG: putative selenate ABC transporter substrate-binding protein [Cyanobacteria bacterium P01_C01_bin.89]